MPADLTGSSFDVVVVGSANVDLVARVARIPHPGETVLGHGYEEHPGGKGLNQAVAAARSGARTCFIGALGNDPAGDRLADVLRDEGIDATHVDRTAQPTGRAVITVDDAAENCIVVIAGANGDVAVDSVPDTAVVLAQLEVPVGAVTAAFINARRAGVRTVLNPAPAADLPSELIVACDVIVPNQHELASLGSIDAIVDAGATIVVTLGSDGAEIIDRAGRRRQRAFEVDPVDTTGAGDAFCGSLAARLAAGDTIDEAVRWAAAAGALATRTPGAVPSQPRLADIERLISGEV